MLDFFYSFIFFCDQKGLDIEGLFRISASSAEMKKWIEMFDNGWEFNFLILNFDSFTWKTIRLHEICGCV